jgi:hypothetical protein
MHAWRTLQVSCCALALSVGAACSADDEGALDRDEGDAGDGSQGGSGGGDPSKCDAAGDVPFLWAKRVAAESTIVGVKGFAVTADGTMFATGAFNNELVLGPNDAEETTLDSMLGSYDVWLARFAPDGTLEWARQAGGTLDEEVATAALAEDGSFLVAGTFGGTGVFGKGEALETQLQAKGEQDAFLARFEADGTLAWVKRIGGSGGTGVVELRQLLPAADGSLRVLGTMEGSVIFGDGEALQSVLASGDEYSSADQFIASFDEDGALAWVKRVDGVSMRAELRDDGGLDMRGYNSSTLTRFALGESNETALDQFGPFRASYAEDGALESVRLVDESVVPGSAHFVRSPDGSYHIAGAFEPSITLGKGQPNEITLNTTSIALEDGDIFVARYDADDQLLWAKTAGGDLEDSARAIAVGSDGTLRLVGSFSNSITVGPGELGAVKLSGSTGSGFLANYAPDGTLISAKNAVMGNEVRILPDDTLRVIGLYNERGVTLGEGEPGSVVLPGSAFQNLFVAGYGACP